MKCLLISDIHGNWPALRAVLEAEHDADQILCLGDLVNYGPQPAECVAWAMKLRPPNQVIQGNHDRDFARGSNRHDVSAIRPFAQAVKAATRPLITAEMRRFLAGLEPLQEFSWSKILCFACHRVSDHSLDHDSVQRIDDEEWDANELNRMHSDIILTGVPGNLFVLVGHPDFLFLADSHLAMKTKLYGTVIVNPGSTGMPADGDPRAAYGVWRDGEVTLHRVVYEIEETARAYERLDLDEHIKQQLVEGLRTGNCLVTDPAVELATAN